MTLSELIKQLNRIKNTENADQDVWIVKSGGNPIKYDDCKSISEVFEIRCSTDSFNEGIHIAMESDD